MYSFSKSGGLGAFLISSLAISFLPTSNSLSSEPKASIVDSILCHVMVNVSLHTFIEIAGSKSVFLNIFRWNIIVIGNLSRKI